MTLLPALLLAPLIAFSMPFLREEVLRNDGERKGFFRTIGALFAVLYPIWALSLIRDLLFQSMRFFLPLKIVAEGGALESVGTVVFSLNCCSTLAMIPMGVVARRFGKKRVLQGSLLAGAFVLCAAFFATGFFATALSVLGVACVYSTLPLTVTIAQGLAPNERSAASSIVMGLAWGFSNILLSPFGKLADLWGLEAAFIFMVILPLLGIPFFWTRPFRKMDSRGLEC